MNYTRTGFWLPTNTGDQVQLWLCSGCGSVVFNMVTHDEWHRRVENHGHPYAPPPEADPITFADTCCGKCPFGTCYVDQMTGA